jgi:hypothetical protein
MAARKAKAKMKSVGKRWFDHRGLLISEAVMAVGLLQEVLEHWVLGLETIPPLLRVLAGVGIVVGTMGGLLLVVRKSIQKGLKTTHSAVSQITPLPSVVVHLGIVSLLFLGYAIQWDEQTGALTALWSLLGR